ncbi:hypothetical protein [Mycobacterium paragordonae]|uniref:hypothetical protein n=1 Tax=Mycobacterium paragordonae TaxID=1389713 RepID=UPI0013C46B66|nr:hypothetical protein [Mycobacterium paragordonae]
MNFLSGEGLVQKASGRQPWGLQHFGGVVIHQAAILDRIAVGLSCVGMAHLGGVTANAVVRQELQNISA